MLVPIGSSNIISDTILYIYIQELFRGTLILVDFSGLDILKIYKRISQNVNFESRTPNRYWLESFFILM